MMIHFVYILIFLNFAADAAEPFSANLGNPLIEDSLISSTNRGFYQDRFYINVYDSEQLSVMVDSYSGNLFVRRTDFISTNYMYPFDATFYYNSGSSYYGQYGNRWQLKYHIRYATNNYNKKLLFISETDKSELFTPDSLNYYYSDNNSDSAIFLGNFLLLSKPNNPNYANLHTKYIFDAEARNIKEVIIAERDTVSIIFDDFYCKSVNLRNNHYQFSYHDKLLNALNFNNNKLAEYYYDIDDNLIAIDKFVGDDFSFEYDDCNLLSKIIFSDSLELIFKYNDSLQISEVFYSDDKSNGISIQYFPDYSVFTDFLHGNYTVHYDDNGSFRRLVNPNGDEKKVLAENNNKFSVTDYRKNSYLYENYYNSFKLTNPLQNSLLIKSNDFGVESRKNYNNDIEYFDYLNGNLSVKTNFEGEKYYFSHNSKSELIEFTDTKGNSTKFIYDDYGNIRQLQINDLEPIKFEYDEFGNISIIDDSHHNYKIETDNNKFNKKIVRDDSVFYKMIAYTKENISKIVIDRDTLEYGYDKFGRLIITDNYQIKYNDYSAEIINHNDIYKIIYDSLYRIITIIKNDFDVINNSYDANNNLLKITKNAAIFNEFEYDKLNRLIFNNDYKNISQKLEYDNLSNVILSTYNNNDHIYYTYDKIGRMTNVKYGNFNIIEAQYINDKIIINDNNSNIYTYLYDELDRLKIRKINQDTVLANKYFSYSYLPSEIDSAGINKKIIYDRFGNLSQIAFNDSLLLKLVYSKQSQLLNYSFNDIISSKVSISGDNYQISDIFGIKNFIFKGEKLSSFIADDERINFQYYPNSLIKEINYEQRKNLFKYNALGLLAGVANNQSFELNLIRNAGRISEINGPNNSKFQFEYYPNNSIRTIINADNLRTSLSRNNFSLLTSILLPDNSTREMAYTSNFNIDFYNENGNIYDFKYNSRNSIISIIDPEFSAEIIKYDSDNKVSSIQSELTELNISYSHFNYINSLSNSDLAVAISRDNLLRIKQIQYASDIISYIYSNNSVQIDLNGEKAAYFDFANDSLFMLNASLVISRGNNSAVYDKDSESLFIEQNEYGLLSNANKDNSNSVSFSYDEMGRISLKSFSDSYFELMDYFPSGNIKSISTPDKITRFTYNQLGILSSIFLSESDSISYTYDRNGLITQIILPENITYSINRSKRGDINSIEGLSKAKIDFLITQNNLKIIAEENYNEYYFDKSFRINNINSDKLHPSGFKLFDNEGKFADKFSFNDDLTLKNTGGKEYIYTNALLTAVSEDSLITIAKYNNNKINELALSTGNNYQFYYSGNHINKIIQNGIATYEKIIPVNNRELYYLQPYDFEVVKNRNRIDSIIFDRFFCKFNYDAYGNIKEIISNTALNDSYFFDANGNLIYFIRENKPNDISYNKYFQIESILNNNSGERLFEYNNFGQLEQTSVKGEVLNITNYNYEDSDKLGNLSFRLDDKYFFADFEYDSSNYLIRKSNNYGFELLYENYGNEIIFADDTVRIFKNGDTLRKFLPNGIIENKVILSDGMLAAISLIYEDSIIFEEIYQYNSNKQLTSIINRNDVLEFKYNYKGLLFNISKNNREFISFERNNYGLISKKIINLDTVNYQYNNNLQLISINDINYQYDKNHYLVFKQAGENQFQYKFNQTGKLTEIIRNSNDTLKFIYNGEEKLIAFSDSSMKYITYEDDGISPFTINSDNDDYNFIRYGKSGDSPDCLMINDSAVYFHRAENGFTIITSDMHGNISEDIFSPSLIPDYENANIGSLDSSLIFKDYQVFCKNGLFYDIDSQQPIQPDYESIFNIFNKNEDTQNLNISLKLEDIIQTQPNYFRFYNFKPLKIEKDIYRQSLDRQFNKFKTFDILIDFEPIVLFHTPRELPLEYLENLKILEPIADAKLPEQLSNPHIRSFVLSSDNLNIPKVQFPSDPLEKIIFSLEELGYEYEAIVNYLKYIQEVYNSQLVSEYPEFISSPLYFEFSEEEINEIAGDNPFRKQYKRNFGEQFDWFSYLYQISNMKINKAFARIEEYEILDRSFQKREFAVSLNYYDESAFMPKLPAIFSEINEINKSNFDRILKITDIREFNGNKLFLPGRAVYSSPVLELPYLLNSPNFLIKTPLNQKKFDILHFEIE